MYVLILQESSGVWSAALNNTTMDAIDVPGYCRHLLGNLHELWSNQSLCDTQVCSQNGGLFTHKLLLMAASPYFANLFKESYGYVEESEKILKFESVTQGTLKAVISLLYTGKLSINKENAEEIKTFCEMLELKCAIDAIDSYIQGVPEVPNDSIEGKAEAKEKDGKIRLKLKYKASDFVTETNEPVKKKRKCIPRKEKVKTLSDSKRLRGRKTQISKQKTVLKPTLKRTKKIVKQEKNVKVTEVVERDHTEKDNKQQIDDTDINRIEIVGIKEEAHKTLEEEEDEPEPDEELDDDYYSDTDNVEIDSNLDESSDAKTRKTSKPKTKGKAQTVCLKRGRKAKTKEEEVTPKEKTPRLPKKRLKKEFPCTQCSKILSSYKRRVFHEFSKHGTPYDTSQYSMVPCEEQVCTLLYSNSRVL